VNQQLTCLLGKHAWGPWQLRPPTIGRHVTFLYWQRTCQREAVGGRGRPCGGTQRRWFRVRALGHAPIAKPIPVEKYLERIRMTAPAPDDPKLTDSLGPPGL
jgi:hypothetical protein